MKTIVLIITALIALIACNPVDDSYVCDEMAVYALTLTLGSGTNIITNAVCTVSNLGAGLYIEELQYFNSAYSGLVETTGDFKLDIVATNYSNYTTNLSIEFGDCHPISQSLQIELSPAI